MADIDFNIEIEVHGLTIRWHDVIIIGLVLTGGRAGGYSRW